MNTKNTVVFEQPQVDLQLMANVPAQKRLGFPLQPDERAGEVHQVPVTSPSL